MDLDTLFNRTITEPNSGCWLWDMALFDDGYGAVKVEAKQWRAHRYVWTLHNGPIPVDMLVCHKCDQPSCINPSHLFLGTSSENLKDAFKKGRISRESLRVKNGNALKTHCIHGHSFDDANTYVYNTKRFKRVCKTCAKNADRRRGSYGL